MSVELKLPPVVDVVKDHIKRHKRAYLLGSHIAVAGITYAIMRSTIAQRGMGVGIAQRGILNTASFSFGKKSSLNNVSFILSNRQGPPSWIIHCLETGETFLSQRAAAFAKGVNESDLSQHLNGLHENVNGLHFERLGVAV